MFGFLKNKLKEWVDKAKDTLKPEETQEEVEETKKEVKEKKLKKEKPVKEKKQKKSKEKKAIIDASETAVSELAISEPSDAIEVESEIEQGIIDSSESRESEIADKKLEKLEKKELLASDEDVKKAQEEIKETQRIAEELQEGKISEQEAVKEIANIDDSDLEKSELATPKKSFLKKLFGKKTNVDASDSAESEIAKPTFLQKVRTSFIYKITAEDFDSLFNDLEMSLLENNVALEVVEDIKKRLSKKLVGKEIKKENLESEIKKELKTTLEEILIDPDDPIEAIKMKKEKPFVILFFGINGTGKTTSIAKLTHLIKKKNLSVVLAAADTFRAASIEQIALHAKKLDVQLIKHDYGADPSAVGFDAIKYAKSHKIDVVLIDTAGRMHTKTNLLSEMEKICRVTKPDLKIFVAESIAGNDATEQAKTFNETAGIDGSILSKADIDEKGGTIISISHATNKPIFYLGTGQNYEDLKLFNKQEFIKNLGL